MKGCLKVFGYGVAAIIVLGVIAAAFGNNQRSTARPAANPVTKSSVVLQPTLTTEEPPTPTPDWMAPSFSEICDTNSTMTDIQQENLNKSLVGKKVVDWSGKVYDVERSGDSFVVQVDMEDDFFESRQIEITGVAESVAVGLNVKQQIAFTGTIERIDMFAGTTCNPVVIVDAQIVPQ